MATQGTPAPTTVVDMQAPPQEVDFKEIGEEPVALNDDFSNIVICDGLPIVGDNRFGKLKTVLKNLFSKSGTLVEDGIEMFVKDGKSLGFAFICYEHPSGAADAVLKLDNKKLDRSHTLRVSSYAEFDRVTTADEEYVPLTKNDYEARDNLCAWLTDDEHRDQYVVRFSDETHIYWNDPVRRSNEGGRELVYGGEREKARGKCWTELYTNWSKNGSYLATFHQQGIVLWGGGGDKDNGDCSFNKLQRFMHAGVKLIDFSPCEQYLVTCNGIEKDANGNDPDAPECIIVWNCRTGRKIRGFDGGISRQWPAFSWSHDDKFLSRIGKDLISVYETPTLDLVDKKSVVVPGVRQCQWSPTANTISYWTPETGNHPAKVVLMSMPSREVLREKHLYNVQDVVMHWHDQGTYLGVKLARQKTKKTIINNFEIFRVTQKNIPVEVLEMTDSVHAFAWEPHGHRFAIVHTVHQNASRFDVSFYQLKSNKIKLLHTIKDRPANHIFWSPSGRHCVIAGLGQLNGALEFFDVNTGESLVQTEHFMASDVEWDSSGRYVLTAVTQSLSSDGIFNRRTTDNGYRIWSFQGEQLLNVNLEQCYQVMWRPRPASLLTKDEVRKIQDTLKEKYWAQFLKEDEQIRNSQLSGMAKERQERKESWKAYRAAMEKEHAADAEDRCSLRGGLASDDEDDWELRDLVVEEELSRDVELIKE